MEKNSQVKTTGKTGEIHTRGAQALGKNSSSPPNSNFQTAESETNKRGMLGYVNNVPSTQGSHTEEAAGSLIQTPTN